MEKKKIFIVGAGGHAAVVADAVLESGVSVEGFFDNDLSKKDTSILGSYVLGSDEGLTRLVPKEVALLNGVGGIIGTSIRKKIQERIEQLGFIFIGCRHPFSSVSREVEVEEGVQIMKGSLIQSRAVIRKNSIVNTGAIIEHDVEIGSWTHVAPGATICGSAQVGKNCHIGAGSTIIEGVKLAPSCVLGAGAVLTDDFHGSGVLVGVPARPIG